MPETESVRMSELTYPFEEHVPRGTTHEVAPGVHWLTMPMGGSLNHINLYLLEDRDGWFVVDTGLRNEETHDLWHQIFDDVLGAKPVKGVICTHMHPDHTGMAGMITEHFRAPLYMTWSEFYQARSFFGGGSSQHSGWQAQEFYKRAGMDVEAMERMRNMWTSRRGGNGDETAFTMPELPMSFQRLEDGDVIAIGDHDWQVVVGAGHSPEHACLHCRSLHVLLSGDQILPVITSNVSVHPTEPEANPLKIWMESHDKFLRLPNDTLVLPAHNLPFYGVRERLRQLIEHHEDRMLTLEENCIEPSIAVDLLPFLFKRELDQRQMFMALGECIAHLHLLMYRNRIERTLGEDETYRFRSIDPTLPRRMHPGDHDEPDETPILV
jgi:glyoxylase-like metal-dependent hydrolase (beta-lactamase superfamily II)